MNPQPMPKDHPTGDRGEADAGSTFPSVAAARAELESLRQRELELADPDAARPARAAQSEGATAVTG